MKIKFKGGDDRSYSSGKVKGLGDFRNAIPFSQTFLYNVVGFGWFLSSTFFRKFEIGDTD